MEGVEILIVMVLAIILLAWVIGARRKDHTE